MINTYKRINRKHSIQILASKEQLFSFLCLVKENKWMPGFSSQTVFSDSGLTEIDSVFFTQTQMDEPTTWIVPMYEQYNFIEMIYFQPHVKVVIIKLTLFEVNTNKTDLQVEYIYTAISKDGEKELESISDSKFEQFIDVWKVCLNYYFKNGSLIPESLLPHLHH